jgi:hypothetical protein
MYEFEVVCYAGASRAFKKDLDAFWKGIKIEDK